jgi:hypothetical protein
MSKTNEFFRSQDEDKKMEKTSIIEPDIRNDKDLLDPAKVKVALECWLKMVEAGEVLERLVDSDYVMDAQEEAPKLNYQRLRLFAEADDLMINIIDKMNKTRGYENA